MHSAWTPRAAKWRRVISGYLVATRRWLQLRGSSCPAHRPARPRPCGNARYRGRAARRSRNSRIPSARRCRRPRAGRRRRRRRSRRRSCAPGSGRAPGSEVRKRSCRLAGSLKAGSGSMPMRCNSGMTSPRMRPFGKRHDQRPIARRRSARAPCRVDGGSFRSSSSSWPGCHGVGQGSPKSRARQRIAEAVSRIAAPPAKSRSIVSPGWPLARPPPADRQQGQDAILLAALEAAIGHGRRPRRR